MFKAGIIQYSSAVAYGQYGFEWNQGTDSVARLDDSVGLVANAINASGNGVTSPVNDFNSIAPWVNVRRCNLADNGTVNAYYGDASYKDDGTNGQVMVEIPKFYYKYEKVSSTFRWWISEVLQDSYSVHPAFIRNGIEIDKVYLGAYETSSSNQSRSGASVQVDQSITRMRTNARSRGYNTTTFTGWNLSDFLSVSALQLLYVVEYAHFDTQTKIGKGVTSTSDRVETGQTTGLGNYSGMATGTNGLVSVSYRGVENLWGNTSAWIDGINITSSDAYIADHNYISDKFNGQYSLVGRLPNSSGTISNILDIGYGFLPLSTGGTSYNSHLYDSANRNTASNRAFLLGGYSNNQLRAGAFCCDWYYGTSYTYPSFGGRLSYYS